MYVAVKLSIVGCLKQLRPICR